MLKLAGCPTKPIDPRVKLSQTDVCCSSVHDLSAVVSTMCFLKSRQLRWEPASSSVIIADLLIRAYQGTLSARVLRECCLNPWQHDEYCHIDPFTVHAARSVKTCWPVHLHRDSFTAAFPLGTGASVLFISAGSVP